MARLKTGILISGRGSNLQALIGACAAPDFPAAIALVIADRADALGLAHARNANIRHRVLPPQSFPDRASFDEALDATLSEADIELVCLAGFMPVLGPTFVERWRDRLINIHPSLLPTFPGLKTHRRALAAGVRFSGCTVHFVRAELDKGPIIAQAAVPVVLGDTEESLAARVLEAEHRIYPLVLSLIAAGQVKIVNDRVAIAGVGAAPRTVFYPVP
jgi:phosphoribosylglycinamide formyltransferase-1